MCDVTLMTEVPITNAHLDAKIVACALSDGHGGAPRATPPRGLLSSRYERPCKGCLWHESNQRECGRSTVARFACVCEDLSHWQLSDMRMVGSFWWGKPGFEGGIPL